MQTAEPAPGAIIIGGDYRGLGVVRSLGRHGIPVCVLTDEHTLAGYSRFTRLRIPLPVEPGPDQVADFLLQLAASHKLDGWLLFPTSDESTALIASHYEQLGRRFVLSTPPWEILRWAYDKRLTYQMAAEVGVFVPKTYYPRSVSDVANYAVVFPAILKPAFKRAPSRFTQEKAWPVVNRAQLIARYQEACTMIEPDAIMLQEFIPGEDRTQYSFGALCRDGQPLASIVTLRRRQYPIDFGYSSSCVESIVEPEVERLACRLLERVRITGLVEVEFKRDQRDGTLKLLDINPRVWGWHTLGQRAGVDFPFLTWRMFNGHDIEARCGCANVRWIRGTTNLMAAAQAIRFKRFSLRSQLHSMRPPIAFAIWAFDDPMPVLCEIPTVIRAQRRVARAMAHATREPRLDFVAAPTDEPVHQTMVQRC